MDTYDSREMAYTLRILHEEDEHPSGGEESSCCGSCRNNGQCKSSPSEDIVPAAENSAATSISTQEK